MTRFYVPTPDPTLDSLLSNNPELYSPIAHWPFDGDLVDTIDAKTLSAIAGTINYGRGFGDRKVARFNGSSYVAFTGDNSEFQRVDLSVAYWFFGRSDAYMTHFAIDSPNAVDADDNATIHITRWTNSAPGNYVSIGSETGTMSSTAITNTALTALPGQWHHLVLSRSTGGVYSGYLDGEPLFPTPPSAVTVTPGINGQLTLGSLRPTGTNLHHGSLSSVMVWDRALTDAEQQTIVRSVGLTVGT